MVKKNTKSMKIYIILPAYNEALRIGKVLKKLQTVTNRINVVDDGSIDLTAQIATRFEVKIIKHKINLGKGAAMLTGCEAAFNLNADAVVLMDSDGQHKVEDLKKFIKALKTKKYDIIFGIRDRSQTVPIIRSLGNKFASFLIKIMFGIYISDLLCGYRAFTRESFQKLYWQSSGYGVETEMVIATGKHKLRYCELPIETLYFDQFKLLPILNALSIFFSVLKCRLLK